MYSQTVLSSDTLNRFGGSSLFWCFAFLGVRLHVILFAWNGALKPTEHGHARSEFRMALSLVFLDRLLKRRDVAIGMPTTVHGMAAMNTELEHSAGLDSFLSLLSTGDSLTLLLLAVHSFGWSLEEGKNYSRVGWSGWIR